jgi:IclR helix-turn-helix domain/Ribbon-helix-helix protein, copG family
MLPAMSRHQIEQMRAQGLSQREISRRTGMPRSTMQRLLKAPHIPQVLPEGRPQGDKSRPLPQSVAKAGPVLLEMAAWWMQRQAAAASPVGGRGETRRYTFHADVSLIDLVQREADAERVSYSEVINRALRQYFVGSRI